MTNRQSDTTDERNEHRKLLIELLRNTKVVDRDTHWIHLNKVWYSPDKREIFYKHFRFLFDDSLSLLANTTILYPDGIYSRFGAFPFACFLAEERKLPLAVWKEFGNVLEATPILISDARLRDLDNPCVIIQDVVNKGTLLRKMCPSIKDAGWKVIAFVSIIQVMRGNSLLQESLAYSKDFLGAELNFVPLIQDTEL